jgi:hypothetical protein
MVWALGVPDHGGVTPCNQATEAAPRATQQEDMLAANAHGAVIDALGTSIPIERLRFGIGPIGARGAPLRTVIAPKKPTMSSNTEGNRYSGGNTELDSGGAGYAGGNSPPDDDDRGEEAGGIAGPARSETGRGRPGWRRLPVLVPALVAVAWLARKLGMRRRKG